MKLHAVLPYSALVLLVLSFAGVWKHDKQFLSCTHRKCMCHLGMATVVSILLVMAASCSLYIVAARIYLCVSTELQHLMMRHKSKIESVLR